jgi:hypothetical protein
MGWRVIGGALKRFPDGCVSASLVVVEDFKDPLDVRVDGSFGLGADVDVAHAAAFLQRLLRVLLMIQAGHVKQIREVIRDQVAAANFDKLNGNGGPTLH